MSEEPVDAAVRLAKERGVADLSGVRAVAHRTLNGEWPGEHPAETSTRGRERLMDLYKPVVKAAVQESPETAQRLEKSGRLERLTFKARIQSGVRPIFKDDGRFIIWGPASVEVVDKEGDRIKAKALEKALPQLLKRARLSVEHTDQLVGDILESFETEEPVEVEVNGTAYERDTFPTAVMELDDQPPALYVCGEVYDDSNYALQVRKDIEDGVIRSYSISGEALVTKTSIEDGTLVDDILEMDLSAVTLCQEGMNQEAAFAVVAKAEDADDAGEARLRLTDVAAVAKHALDNTMDDNTLSKEDLIKTFEEVLADYGVVSKDEMTAYVDEAVSTPMEPAVETPTPEEPVAPAAEEEAPEEAPTEEPSEEEAPAEEEETEPAPVDKNAKEVANLMAEQFNVDPEKVLALLEEAMGESYADEAEEEPVESAEEAEEAPDDVDADAEGEEPAVDADPAEEDAEEPDVDMAPDADVGAFGEETASHAYGPDDLQEMLPDDVWEVVRQYLATDEEAEVKADDVAYEEDEEDADSDEETGGEPELGKAEVSDVVRHELNKHLNTAGGAPRPLAKGEDDPSHENKELEKEVPVSRTILAGFYDN